MKIDHIVRNLKAHRVMYKSDPIINFWATEHLHSANIVNWYEQPSMLISGRNLYVNLH